MNIIIRFAEYTAHKEPKIFQVYSSLKCKISSNSFLDARSLKPYQLMLSYYPYMQWLAKHNQSNQPQTLMFQTNFVSLMPGNWIFEANYYMNLYLRNPDNIIITMMSQI